MCLDGSRLLEALAKNDLSDSFDKGSLSRRKILGVGVCVIAEKAFRGITSGVPRQKVGKKEHYDLRNADDVIEGWTAFTQELVYEEGPSKIVKLLAETSDLKNAPTLVQAAHAYASTMCVYLFPHLSAAKERTDALLYFTMCFASLQLDQLLLLYVSLSISFDSSADRQISGTCSCAATVWQSSISFKIRQCKYGSFSRSV